LSAESGYYSNVACKARLYFVFLDYYTNVRKKDCYYPELRFRDCCYCFGDVFPITITVFGISLGEALFFLMISWYLGGLCLAPGDHSLIVSNCLFRTPPIVFFKVEFVIFAFVLPLLNDSELFYGDDHDGSSEVGVFNLYGDL